MATLDVLVVDDEEDLRGLCADALRAAGHTVTAAATGTEALAALSRGVYDLVITDVRLPQMDGLTLFRRVRQESPGTDVIFITAFGAVAEAVQALKEGAHDYLTKPFDVEEVIVRVGRIAAERSLNRELEQARTELAESVDPDGTIVGRSPQVKRLLERIGVIAQSRAPVLITGESGTGKELAARSLHQRGPRGGKPFVVVSCAAFPETLIEAELFGHERGAFTGAVRRREGRFKAADGGTLMLDEIAELPAPAQAKLLRVLQEGTIEPLGTNETIQVDVRIISATHRNLKAMTAEGTFREDLYFRLNVLDVEVPALRERQGDLTLLVQHFLQSFGRNDTTSAISAHAWAMLQRYPFPGNVRELSHAIEHAVVLAGGGPIGPDHLPSDITGALAAASGEPSLRSLGSAMREFEREYLLRALATVDGRRIKAAEVLGISRKTLWEKLRLHGIADGNGSGDGHAATAALP